MASLTDIFTVGQNIATAINGVAQSYLNVQGVQNKTGIAAATLVKGSAGRCATIIVTTAGSTVGACYDTNSASSTANKFYDIPDTIGVYVVNFPVSTGLVVTPGTGQVVSVSFS